MIIRPTFCSQRVYEQKCVRANLRSGKFFTCKRNRSSNSGNTTHVAFFDLLIGTFVFFSFFFLYHPFFLLYPFYLLYDVQQHFSILKWIQYDRLTMFSVYRCCGSATDDLIVCFLGFGTISYIVILIIETLKQTNQKKLTEHENKFLSHQ